MITRRGISRGMNTDRIKGLEDAIKLQEGIMIETQTMIRQAEDILQKMKPRYQRAMEEKINLQDKLIEEMKKKK